MFEFLKKKKKKADVTELVAVEESKPATASEAPANPEVVDTETREGRGYFEIKPIKSDTEGYVFNLYASNHQIIATSQTYTTASAAMIGIQSVIKHAPIAPIEDQTLANYEPQKYPKWEIYLDAAQKFRFRLNASNGSNICHSQGYTTKDNCKGGIASIIKHSQDAEIDKAYLKNNEEE